MAVMKSRACFLAFLFIAQLQDSSTQSPCDYANCPSGSTCTKTRLEGDLAYQCQCLANSPCYKAGCQENGAICQSKTGKFADFLDSLFRRAPKTKFGEILQQMATSLLSDGTLGLRRSKRSATNSLTSALMADPRGALLANPLAQGQECQSGRSSTCGCQVDGKYLQANTYFSRKPDCTEFCECVGTNTNKFRCSDFGGCPHGLECRSSLHQGFYECVPICNGQQYDLQTLKCCHPEPRDDPLMTGCLVENGLDCCDSGKHECPNRGLECHSIGDDHYECR